MNKIFVKFIDTFGVFCIMKNIIKATGKIIFKGTQKTVDPEYTECKRVLKCLCADAKRLIEAAYNFSNSLQQAALLARKISATAAGVVSDSPQYRGHGQQLAAAAQEIDAMAGTQWKAQTAAHVFAPLEGFRRELEALRALRKNRCAARREFDEARAKAKREAERAGAAPRALEEELQAARRSYEELNARFIAGTRGLQRRRGECLDAPIRCLMATLSQFVGGAAARVGRVAPQMPLAQVEAQFPPNPYANLPPAEEKYLCTA